MRWHARCGVAGVAAIWFGALIGKGATGPALITGSCCGDMCDGVFFGPGALRQELAASGVAGTVSGDEVLTRAAFHRLVWRAGR